MGSDEGEGFEMGKTLTSSLNKLVLPYEIGVNPDISPWTKKSQ